MTVDLAKFERLVAAEERLRRDQDRRAGELAGLLKRLAAEADIQCDSDDPEDLFSAAEGVLRDIEEQEAALAEAYELELAAVEAEFGGRL